jgi:tRNA A-37 threonylcarbamoyl transferase component Bud32
MTEPYDRNLAAGATVGGYRIERRLGEGGVGAVFAAAEPRGDKRVAIKVLRRALADDEGMILRFEREARAVSEIHHPGIVDVFATGRLDDGRPYLVMSLLEGESLRAAIERQHRLAPAEAWRVARAVAEAVGAAHEVGVVHRDLKPDNVFLERAGAADAAARLPRVRVLDFGIAKFVNPEAAGADLVKLTATGVPLGTPAYMAPEQWWSAAVTPRTDQYALGAMLFELLTGRPPFASTQFAELVQMHVGREPPRLADAGAPSSDEVEQLVARLLAKSADDRFASMAAVIEAGDRAFGVGGPIVDEGGVAAALGLSSRAQPGEPSALEPSTLEGAIDPPGESALQRWLSLHAAIVIIGSAAIVAVGYAGAERHDPLLWVRIGGFGQYLIVLWFPIAVFALPRIAKARAETARASALGFWIALAPALQGAVTTYAGFRVMVKAMPRVAAIDQLTIFSGGTHEANAGRFLGFSVSALLFASLAALPGVSGTARTSSTLTAPAGVRGGEALLAAALLGVAAIVAIVIGAPSGALVAGAAAVAVGSAFVLPTLHASTAARDELERAAAGILAVVLALAAGFTRIEAREASLWVETATRAERVAGILASQAERDATLPIAALSLVLVAIVEGVRIARLLRSGASLRPGADALFLGLAIAVGALGDLVQHGRFADARASLRSELRAQFALFSRLDPPAGDTLDKQGFVPHQATALQVTRDVIAVDGKGVARLAALESPAGALHVAADLNRALAQGALDQRGSREVDLSVSVDREVDAGALAHLLRIARAAGVRRIELLLTRGASPELERGGPPEIDVVVPRDFVALPAELADEGLALTAGQPFGRIAPTLVVEALAAHGPIAIAVDTRR